MSDDTKKTPPEPPETLRTVGDVPDLGDSDEQPPTRAGFVLMRPAQRPSDPCPELLDPDNDDMTSTDRQVATLDPAQGAPLVLVLTGQSAGQVFRLGSEPLVVGRAADCGVVLRDAGVSRRHCEIRINRESLGFTLEDRGSTNGTWVNGQRVTKTSLVGEERIRVGSDVILRFALSDENEEALARRLYDGAMRDALTGCYSRRYFDDQLATSVAHAKRHGTELGLVMVDVDHFKRINDEHGHPTGDDVLRGVGEALLAMVRSEDTVARFGGEEFALLVAGTPLRGLVGLAERIRKAIAAVRFRRGTEEIGVTVSAGVAMLGECQTKDELVTLADTRLYGAKRAGRNRVKGS